MSLLHDLPPRMAASLLSGVIAKGPPGGVYLTFDDGPDPVTTPRFIRALVALNTQATFFLTGSKVILHPDVVQALASAGLGIGLHGYNHSSLLRAGRAKVKEEILLSLPAIERITGTQPYLFRPPYGRIGRAVGVVAAELDLKIVLWSLSAEDWKPTNPDIIVSRIVEKISDGDIVLLHDSGKGALSTLKALPGIVQGIRDKGLRIASLPSALL